jgi:DnaJ-domain-containing protein 1
MSSSSDDSLFRCEAPAIAEAERLLSAKSAVAAIAALKKGRVLVAGEEEKENTRRFSTLLAKCLECCDADPWAALGVKPSANDATVKAAYRRLALLYHPDKAGASTVEAGNE